MNRYSLDDAELTLRRIDLLLDAAFEFGGDTERGKLAVSMAADEAKEAIKEIDANHEADYPTVVAPVSIEPLPAEQPGASSTVAHRTVRRPRKKGRAAKVARR